MAAEEVGAQKLLATKACCPRRGANSGRHQARACGRRVGCGRDWFTFVTRTSGRKGDGEAGIKAKMGAGALDRTWGGSAVAGSGAALAVADMIAQPIGRCERKSLRRGFDPATGVCRELLPKQGQRAAHSGRGGATYPGPIWNRAASAMSRSRKKFRNVRMTAIEARRAMSSQVGARADSMMSIASGNASPAISQRA